MDINTRIHDKTGATIYTVKLDGRVDRARFCEIRDWAKNAGGYYSRFIHAFVFPTEQLAEDFLASLCWTRTQDDSGHAPDLDTMLGY